MLFFAIGATTFLLTCVLPKFTAIYSSKRAVLPLPTRILIGLSDWMVGNWMYLVAGLVLAVVGLVLFLRSPRAATPPTGFDSICLLSGACSARAAWPARSAPWGR